MANKSSWAAFVIGEAGEGEPGSIYPVINDEADGVVPEPEDGSNVATFAATSVTKYLVGATANHKDAFVTDVKITCSITDSRFYFACPKYDKGGGWYGGGAAVALNLGSKAIAAVRRRGKCLVGQIRYSNMAQVGYLSKPRRFAPTEALTLYVPERGTEKPFFTKVQFVLAKGESARDMANDIARRTARYRLAQADYESDEERAVLELIVTAGIPHSDKPDEFSVTGFGAVRYVV